MPDISFEAAEYNEDVTCVIGRIREYLGHHLEGAVIPLEQDIELAASAIVNQLILRWFGVDYSPAEADRYHYLRNRIRLMNQDRGIDSLENEHPQP